MFDNYGKKTLLSGNDACAYGALTAGVDFFAGYPITPSSEIAEILSDELPKQGKVFIQMEDEIASISAIIGASIGGAKSMTATSGPGFSLMQEGIGFGIMTEVPVVVVNVQRGGPSTGLPTYPAQGDLMQARWGTHGDHPIIALTCSSVLDMYKQTIRSFNLAEKYRIPVILLSDEAIGHMREVVILPEPEKMEIYDRKLPDVPPEWYKPYERKGGKVTPMASFGSGYRYHITGLTHDEMGFPTSVPEQIDQCIRGLYNKIHKNHDDIIEVGLYDVDDADVIIISLGISARAGLEALRILRKRKVKVGMVELKTLWPFPGKAVRKYTKNAKVIVIPEMNLGQIIHEVKAVLPEQKSFCSITKVNGEIIYPQEIVKNIEEELGL
jgi:2-oxoglutarate ferredoxin oxidoreductase subunit alpha